jgi:hypothetical protein
MPLVMEENVTFDPVDVGLLCPEAVMFHPEDFADLIKEFGHVRDFTTASGFIPHLRG